MDGVKRGKLAGWQLLQALVSMSSLSDIWLHVKIANIRNHKIQAHEYVKESRPRECFKRPCAKHSQWPP